MPFCFRPGKCEVVRQVSWSELATVLSHVRLFDQNANHLIDLLAFHAGFECSEVTDDSLAECLGKLVAWAVV